MKWVRVAMLTAAVAAPSAGCGTVFNLASGDPDNYGGVQRDIQFANDARANGGLLSGADLRATAARGSDQIAAGVALCFLALYGADLSLSFIADTATLPLVMYLRQRHDGATDGACGPAG
jgi:uncharacterized protein YceK